MSPLCLYPATPGWGVWCGCVCLGSAFGCAPPLLVWVLGCVCVRARAPLVPLPFLAGVCGVCVCVSARVSAAPRHSWLGCLGVCVLVCASRLYPATPGCGVRRGCVCSGPGFGCAPPLLAGVLGCLCVCVPASFVPRHSWLGCVVWACVLGLRFRLRPATPGWGVGVCVCSCARSACIPPLLAGVCGVGVCAWARVSAAPRNFLLGFWAVFVFVCALRLYPATPGWGVRRGCACLGSGSGCAPPFLGGVLGCVCVLVRPPRVPRHSWLGCAAWEFVLGLGSQLRPTTPGWGVWCGCVCLGSGFSCAPPLLARVLGCVCVRVPAPLVPRHSWLGCVMWVCVLRLRFRLRPATPGWGVGVCACSYARSACTLPLLAGV